MRARFFLGDRPHRDDLCGAIEGLTRLNVAYLSRTPAPRLYEAGVVYRREGRGCEDWRPVPRIIASGHGDCEDLAAWRAAELRLAGDEAEVVLVRGGPRTWHAVVRRADGSIEDPSRKLGMGR